MDFDLAIAAEKYKKMRDTDYITVKTGGGTFMLWCYIQILYPDLKLTVTLEKRKNAV